MSMMKDIPKGGIAGSILGVLASVFFHRKNDSLTKKALKTGLLGGGGYLLGALLERKFFKSNQNQSS